MGTANDGTTEPSGLRPMNGIAMDKILAGGKVPFAVVLVGIALGAAGPAGAQVELFIDEPTVQSEQDPAVPVPVPPAAQPGGAPTTPAAQPLTARGLLEADREAVLSSEIAARILEMPFEPGDTFAEGDVLVQFDCALYEAQLNGAEAALGGAYRTLANNRQLAAFNSIGQLEVQLSQAAVVEAQAEVVSGQVITERCVVTAPYGGRVVDRLVNPFESVEPGEELLAIADDEQLRVTLIVPSLWLRWLLPGTGFDFTVDETGDVHPATVESLGARIDPVSQTIEVTARLSPTNQAAGLILGMSGTATFAPTLWR